MDLVFIGDCEKHDLTLTVALLMKEFRNDEQLIVVTDTTRSYRYFQGEASGIRIVTDSSEVQDKDCVAIYDWHQPTLPDCKGPAKIILVTACDRSSLEYSQALLRESQVDGHMFVQTECAITPKYVSTLLPVQRSYTYWDSPSRRINWVYDGRVDLRKVEPDFVQAVGELIEDLYEVTKPQQKKLWTYVKKRR
ncbi:hypothetical protein [Paenibacillus puerhi]|uniref:hypothetical protein n=1 Tax=Paenibacillus puerhi TaxID=2692622 RepID=UPI001357296A|nr:hypothetical protein [Paenibacillus puerhi]